MDLIDLDKPRPTERPQIRNVNLDEQFPLFDDALPLGDCFLFTDLIVHVTDKLKFPLAIQVILISPEQEGREVTACFTPFSPKEGYQADERDKNIESRVQKNKGRKEKTNYSANPLVLSAEARDYELEKYDLNRKGGYMHTFTPEQLSFMKRLRLDIYIPSNADTIAPTDENFRPASRYQSQPEEASLKVGELTFNSFYPTDLGPMAEGKNPDSLLHKFEKGLYLQLPTNKGALSSIDAKISLEPEEENQQEEVPDLAPEPPAEHFPPLGVKRKS